MDAVISNTPYIDDIQLNPEEEEGFPAGLVLAAGETVIADKGLALELYDKDYSIFIVNEDGEAVFINSRTDIERHYGLFTCNETDLRRCKIDREREQFAAKEAEREKHAGQHDKGIADIAELTGISQARINALPPDIIRNMVKAYVSAGETETAKQELIKELEAAMPENENKESPIKTVEEQTEQNYNNIDGVLNNIEPEKEKEEKPSIIAFLQEHRNAGKAAPPAPEREQKR